MKIEVTKAERTMIVAALIAYIGMDTPINAGPADLLTRLAFADAADDGPEVAILSVDRDLL